MSLWVDKHRPNSLNKLTCHSAITNKLVSLSKSDELPHLLFFGPNGSGKKTRVMALIKEIYGPGQSVNQAAMTYLYLICLHRLSLPLSQPYILLVIISQYIMNGFVYYVM